MEFETWRWVFFGFAAFIIGMSKSGVPGLGILNVAIFMILLDAKEAVGFGLPLLIIGDLCSIAIYRRHADWGQVLRMAPWAVAGVVIGFFTLGVLAGPTAKLVISCVLLAMLALHVIRELRPQLFSEALPRSYAAGALIGILAAFISTLANAAGPIMTLFLLSMRLPKLTFMGTSVCFFTFLNLFKLPFLSQLGLVDWSSLAANARLVPFVICGSLTGYFFARKVSQKWFERLALWLTAIAVGYMFWQAITAHGSQGN